jgi:bifunctional oligoribonuclease and PAP phosphatase NrnA
LLISCDVASRKRFYWAKDFDGAKLINIDHHLRNDINGKFNFVDPKATSACNVLFHLLKQWAPDKISNRIAECLLLGMLSDSQVFLVGSTTRNALTDVIELIDLGADYSKVVVQALPNKDHDIVKFWGKLLSRAEALPGQHATWVIVTQKDLDEAGLTVEAVDGFANHFAQISNIDVVMFFSENEFGQTRVSLRSKYADVNKVAKMFGGGGHRNAAGITKDTDDIYVFAQEVAAEFK